MSNSRDALVEQEFIRLGLLKVNRVVREKAARIIAGEADLDEIGVSDSQREVKDLVNLYRETKLDEFLRFGFDRLSAEEQLKLLKDILEKPESRFQTVDLGMVLSGRGGLSVFALLKAYKSENIGVRNHARLILESLFFAEKSHLITRDNVGRFIDEVCQMYQFPQPYMITEERLKGTRTTLISFLFNLGSNIYVLSYEKNGRSVHTVIDTGDRRNKTSIVKLFKNNGVEPANIERMLLTHHHSDHSSLVEFLCMLSGARLLAHPNFKADSIELDMSRFRGNIEWLAPAGKGRVRNIGGIDFPILGETIDIGEGAKLEIVGLPQGDVITHTTDQLIFLYTPKNSPDTLKKIGADFRPTDEILFSGDLWLMHPPGFFEETIGSFNTYQLIKERRRRFDFRPQNRREKDALKTNFDLITVKPGHGPEFLGSRIIGTILASRDILVKLGFDENGNKDILSDQKLTPRIKQLKEKAYQNFLEGLKLWLSPVEKAGFGYDPGTVSKFLHRIHKEQSGGGDWVAQDRKERRLDLRLKLTRLKTDMEQPEELRLVAESALLQIQKS